MNPWDVLSWVCSVLLAASAVVIFGFFVRDARGVLNRDFHHASEEEDEWEDEEGRG